MSSIFKLYGMFRVSIVFLLLFNASCDYREIAIPLEVPYEGPKLTIEAQLVNGEIPQMKVVRTYPIGGPVVSYEDELNARVIIYENNQFYAELNYYSDTVRYSSNVVIDGFNQTAGDVAYIERYYSLDHALNFETGNYYHLVVTAPGYADLVSDPVVAADEIEIVDVTYEPPYLNLHADLIFSSVSFSLKKSGLAERANSSIKYHYWNSDEDIMQQMGEQHSSAFSLAIPPLANITLPAVHNGVYIRKKYISDSDFCENSNECSFPAEGTILTVLTKNAAAIAYQEARLE